MIVLFLEAEMRDGIAWFIVSVIIGVMAGFSVGHNDPEMKLLHYLNLVDLAWAFFH